MSDHEGADAAAGRPAPTDIAAALRSRGRLRRETDAVFSEFYRDHVRPLTAFLMRQGASTALAADLAQEAMAKAYRRWNEIHDPRAWVRTVASRDLLRSRMRTREDPVEQVPEPSALLPDPDAATEWELHHHALWILTLLPPRQRQVLAWTLDGFTPTEIAEHLGMAPGAVRASLKKARVSVAARLKNSEEGP